MNREKNGAGEEPHHITTVFEGLLDRGADVRCYVGRKDGEVVATCVTLRKAQRLFLKWVGFDYAALGERSGVYFALVLHAPVRDAYAEGLRVIECGAGAHQAKALRGCSSRAVTTSLAVADATLRPRVAQWLAAFGERRKQAFGVTTPSSQPLAVVSSGACCERG
jgi:predicted N-acyltransferase